MRSVSSTAIAALLVAALGSVGATSAFAQQAPEPRGEHTPGFGMHGDQRGHMNRRHLAGGEHRGMRGGLLDLVCSERGAERLEIGFVRLSHRLELTAEQTPLFEALRTAALAAQAEYAAECDAPQVTAEAQAVPDPAERFESRIDNDALRVELMAGLLPELRAFTDSLTDAQKQALEPRRMRRERMLEMPGSETAPEPAPTSQIQG